MKKRFDTAPAPSPDVLAMKQIELQNYEAQFSDAVALVTRTVENLTDLSGRMANSIEEINAYQAQLEQTKQGLAAKRAANETVIQNFKKLLAVE